MLFNFLLILHIMMGTTALCSSVGAICCKKGSKKHRQFGRWFYYGMTGIFITAIPMSLLKSDSFLLLVAIFSYYLAYSGWRYAKRRTADIPRSDWLVSIGMIIASLGMIGIGLFNLNSEDAIMLMVFGAIGAVFSIRDALTYYSGNISNKTRITRHLGGMLGGTIATFTAVLVVNVQFNPEFVIWLAPTVVFTPLIIYWTRKVMA